MVREALTLATELVKSPTAGWRAFLITVVGGHILWACGVIPQLSGFALADDVMQAQTELDRKLSRLEESQNTLLRIALAQEICRLYVLRNQADGALQRQLQQSLLEKQDEYMEIVGQRYPVAECAPGS